MFNFRIIETENGNQIIDRNLKTPYESLTAVQMVEYIEMDAQLYLMDRIQRKQKAETEGKRKYAKNLLYRLACLCGII